MDATRNATDDRTTARRPADDVDPVLEVEDPGFEDLLATVFDVGSRELDVYERVIETGWTTVTDLSETVEVDRSNVNRALSSLQSKGLVTREPQLLEGGGYQYRYAAVPPERVARGLESGFEEWVRSARDLLAGFPDHLSVDAGSDRGPAGPGTPDAPKYDRVFGETVDTDAGSRSGSD